MLQSQMKGNKEMCEWRGREKINTENAEEWELVKSMSDDTVNQSNLSPTLALRLEFECL